MAEEKSTKVKIDELLNDLEGHFDEFNASKDNFSLAQDQLTKALDMASEMAIKFLESSIRQVNASNIVKEYAIMYKQCLDEFMAVGFTREEALTLTIDLKDKLMRGLNKDIGGRMNEANSM